MEHTRYSYLLICCLENTFYFSFVTIVSFHKATLGKQGKELLPSGNLFEEAE